VTDLVSKVGGYVLDSQRFSNNALMLRIQLPPNKKTELVVGLRNCCETLDAESSEAVVEYAKGELALEGDVTCTLFMRFVHDEPDWRTKTPAVPG
jgi:hypothetical protein